MSYRSYIWYNGLYVQVHLKYPDEQTGEYEISKSVQKILTVY